MKSLNNNIRIVNNGPSAVRSVAAGGLAALRSNRTIVSLSDGRTPGVVAGSGIWQAAAGLLPAAVLQTFRFPARRARL